MRFHELSKEAETDIVRQIKALLDSFSNRRWLGRTRLPKNLSLFESCREVILDLPARWAGIIREQESDLIEQWRRPQVTWYHQLRTTYKSFGFARSIEVDGPEKHRVIEVIPSTVAQEFRKAIRFIDSEESENEVPGNEPTAVLLHVPRYAFYGLATKAMEAESRVSLVYPFFHEGLGLSNRKLEREPFISLLKSLPTAFGVLGAGESESEPEPNPEESFGPTERAS